ncbi:TlpA disulfide reductase family protein [Halomonas halocynthiae]|uniref:TlpA disulfide reductase family protein n=1 Tax=Halomonas halocynthiae TaxID=176290 RepID=UPI000417E6C4|nr:TlpA disulfide reductase family protein [Halomonas halocynthiae]
MEAIAFGTMLIPLPRLYALLVGLGLLGASAVLLGLPRQQHIRWFSGLLLVWLISARLGHIALHLASYMASPLDVLRFWLPGFEGSAGLLGVLLWSVWSLRDRFRAMLGAAGLCIITSLLWLLLMHIAPFSPAATPRQLPELSLSNLEGDSIALSELQDQHVIINLWASWCPPCRRELPLLAELDTHDDVTVVVINQGEDLLPVVRYLDNQRLNFRYALLDPRQRMAVASAAPGPPTTLLLNRHGRITHRHIGELSRATLNAWLISP